MKLIKVLVVDNDVFVRRFFCNILDSYKAIKTKVICDFENLPSIIEKENFDIAFVNVGEGSSNGERIVDTIAKRNTQIILLAMAKRTEEGADSIIKALNEGAVDFITIPAKHKSVLLAYNHFEKRIKYILNNTLEANTISTSNILTHLRNKKIKRKQAKMVILGSGSEGIRTLHKLFRNLPGSLSTPMILVSNFPKIFTKKLAESLNKESALTIEEAFDGAELKRGSVWVIPGGKHGEVIRKYSGYYIRLHAGPKENDMRPSIDVTFRSVARQVGAGSLGILLSGYGCDGINGSKAIKEHGGDVIIQEPNGLFAKRLLLDSVEAGLVDQICTEETLSLEILKRAHFTMKKIKKETAHNSDIV